MEGAGGEMKHWVVLVSTFLNLIGAWYWATYKEYAISYLFSISLSAMTLVILKVIK